VSTPVGALNRGPMVYVAFRLPSIQRSETSSVPTDYDELRNDVKESG
jgi:hypothetical protein